MQAHNSDALKDIPGSILPYLPPTHQTHPLTQFCEALIVTLLFKQV